MLSPIETSTFSTFPGNAALTGVASPEEAAVVEASMPALTSTSYNFPLTVAFLPSIATEYFLPLTVTV